MEDKEPIIIVTYMTEFCGAEKELKLSELLNFIKRFKIIGLRYKNDI